MSGSPRARRPSAGGPHGARGVTEPRRGPGDCPTTVLLNSTGVVPDTGSSRECPQFRGDSRSVTGTSSRCPTVFPLVTGEQQGVYGFTVTSGASRGSRTARGTGAREPERLAEGGGVSERAEAQAGRGNATTTPFTRKLHIYYRTKKSSGSPVSLASERREFHLLTTVHKRYASPTGTRRSFRHTRLSQN